MTLDFDINWLAAIVAAIAAFAIGAVWYSPVLFATVWQREAKISDAEIADSNMAAVFGSAFIFTLIAVVVFAAGLGPSPEIGDALLAGLIVALGFVATTYGITYLFERRSVTLWAINSGYFVVLFVVAGLILGLWP